MTQTLKSGFLLWAVVTGANAYSQADAPDMANRGLPYVAGGWPAEQQFTDLPAFREQTPRLTRIPHATGPRVSLFNGKDLSEFTPWLGYVGGGMFPSSPDEQPLGEVDGTDVFKPVIEDGRPALYISGKIWGALITKRDLGNYHLHVWYKFRQNPHPGQPQNSGLLYHSHGPHGAFAHTWMSSLECEVMTDLTGMVSATGRDIGFQTELSLAPGPGLYGSAHNYFYMPGGKLVDARMPTPVRQARVAERPDGQWNKVDLYVAGDSAVQVVNDIPVMAISKITFKDADGVVRPLTHGLIQFQSEGSEIYMRDIWVEPIRTVPKVIAR